MDRDTFLRPISFALRNDFCQIVTVRVTALYLGHPLYSVHFEQIECTFSGIYTVTVLLAGIVT